MWTVMDSPGGRAADRRARRRDHRDRVLAVPPTATAGRAVTRDDDHPVLVETVRQLTAPTSTATSRSSTCRSPRWAPTSSSGCGSSCATIGYGETASYGQIAGRLGLRPTPPPGRRPGQRPQPDPDRDPVPPGHRRQRHAHRLRRRARAQADAARARAGRAVLTPGRRALGPFDSRRFPAESGSPNRQLRGVVRRGPGCFPASPRLTPAIGHKPHESGSKSCGS